MRTASIADDKIDLMKQGWVALVCLGLAAGCGEDVESVDAKGDPGALVATSMSSQVGVLLDEIPAAHRSRVAQRLLAKPSDFWIQRARNQIRLTTYRLVFRQYFYSAGGSKMQLPLPPEEVQKVTLVGAPRRATVDGHDYVLVDYKMSSVLVTTEASPKASDSKLANIGGVWEEPFILPIDPELLFQRTRFACMDEEDFPANSVDSEEVDSFYDQDCNVESSLGPHQCHQTELVMESCVSALDRKVGRVNTVARFERLKWNAGTADQFRVGEITNYGGSDLDLIEEEFRSHRVVYRYIPPSSCTLVEGCVGGSGWRRLLQFSTSDKNTGTETLDIGPVNYYLAGGNGYLDDWGLFELSACHQHYHFKHYGDFHYGPEIERKNGFCLQSTARVMNHEYGPLTNAYGGCDYQGVEASWADQYKAGLECQWVDVTTVNTDAGEVTHPLSFTSNPEGFLCEGTPILDAQGNPLFEATDLVTEAGTPVYKPACERLPGWEANNGYSYDVTLPQSGGSYVTLGCDRGQIGPLRNCGFEDTDLTFGCTPGAQTRLRCDLQGGTTAQPQLARVCDYSFALGTGTACTYQDSLQSSIVERGGTTITFTCPTAKAANEPGGRVSLYTGAMFPDDPSVRVVCTPI